MAVIAQFESRSEGHHPLGYKLFVVRHNFVNICSSVIRKFPWDGGSVANLSRVTCHGRLALWQSHEIGGILEFGKNNKIRVLREAIWY
jgi:hypothetical protein